jgi:hypothetical protein
MKVTPKDFKASLNKGMFRQIVDRCHVSCSDLSVIRFVISRFKHGHSTWRQFPRVERRKALRMIVKIHKENRAEFMWVMGRH